MISTKERKKFSLGGIYLEPEKRLLTREGEPVHLANRPFQVLIYLIEHRDRMVSRNELLDKFWDGHDVYEVALSKCIGAIRKVLGDKLDEPRYIETRWAEGYRYIGEFEEYQTTLTTEAIENNAKPQAVGLAIGTELQSDIKSTDEAITEVQNPVVTKKVSDKTSVTFNEPIYKKVKARPILFLALLCGLITLVISVIWFLNRVTQTNNQSTAIRSVAVIPLKNLTGDSEQDYLADGMTESLISSLSKIAGLKVISRSSVFSFKGKEINPKEIGKQLGVEAILEGSVRREGEQLRVMVWLVDTRDGRVLWTNEIFSHTLQNIFALQDEIARNVIAGLKLTLGGEEEKHLGRRYTENIEAYHLYLKGRFFWNKRMPESLLKAVEQFNKAKELDPNFALAYAGLADCYVIMAEYRVMPSSEAFTKARGAAMKALEIDDNAAETRTALAYILAFHDWDFPAAGREFKLAIEQSPNYATAHQWYAEYLQAAGRFDEGLTELRRAEEIDPLSLIIKTDIAAHFYFTRQYDKAIEQSKNILGMDPNFGWGYGFLWLSYKEKGLLKESVEAHIKNDELFGESQENLKVRRVAFTRSGWRGYWLKWFEQNESSAKWQVMQSLDKAAVYTEIGDREHAIKFLQESFERRERWFLYTKFAPQFDSLRTDPRFQDLIKRVGLN